MESILLSDGRTYARLYLRLLKKLNRVDPMQCILVLIADSIAGTRLNRSPYRCGLKDTLDHDERISLFTSASDEDPELPYDPLLR